jgi:8-oxo-dGTP pyrophosphatase MutT (NUDIX family)
MKIDESLKPYFDFLASTNKKAGVLITYKTMMLVGQAGYYGNYDIFKGSINKGETPIQGALRELYEESGLKLVPEVLQYLGKYEYERKVLHLYHYELSRFINSDVFHCKSMVPALISPTGKSYPEMVHFKWIPIPKLTTYLNLKLSNIIYDAIEKIA